MKPELLKNGTSEGVSPRRTWVVRGAKFLGAVAVRLFQEGVGHAQYEKLRGFYHGVIERLSEVDAICGLIGMWMLIAVTSWPKKIFRASVAKTPQGTSSTMPAAGQLQTSLGTSLPEHADHKTNNLGVINGTVNGTVSSENVIIEKVVIEKVVIYIRPLGTLTKFQEPIINVGPPPPTVASQSIADSNQDASQAESAKTIEGFCGE
jgi:hypothetical protein